MSEMGWVGIKVKNDDGRSGVIRSEQSGFQFTTLLIRVDGAEDGRVDLCCDGLDEGERGWWWLCENFSGGAHWLRLGDHNEDRKARRAEKILP